MKKDLLLSLLSPSNSYIIPSFLFKQYKALGIKDSSFILLIYLYQKGERFVLDYSYFSEELELPLENLMDELNHLKEKRVLEITLETNKDGIKEEIISLKLLYEKLFSIFADEKEERADIYSTFESEFGRTLSPIEYQIISSWLNVNYAEEIILLALKEAVYNGVSNL